MKIKTKLVASLLMAGTFSMANAATYNVVADFKETMTNGVNTVFKGSFDWDGSNVTNFTGRMNESMQGPWVASGNDYIHGETNLDNQHQMLTLDKWDLTSTSVNGNLVTHTVFETNNTTTDVYRGGGYDGGAANYIKYGGGMGGMMPPIAGETPNENAFFTLLFQTDTNGDVITGMFDATSGWANDMIYGDCTTGSLMMGGQACMAGEKTGMSMMAATPLALEITAVTAVPVPAAAWLFGSAMIGLLGVNRRKNAAIV